jgi:ABC-2 type transport system ATP-binding protein
MNSVVRTESLTKYYGSHRGIIDVDLEVHAGEVFGFLGPNGAGKTTTIRLLLDHIRPTSGRATVFDIETTADPVAIHRRIGYLPGEFNLYDRLTGAQTIDYFANLRGGVDAEYQRTLIERLDLDPSRRYREYSRGNKQKVALVCALQHRPDLLVLDEPTAGLDPLVQQTFFALIHEATSEGRTVFFSSHVISEVERVCDRVAIIRDGKIVEVDSVHGLRRMAVHHVELRFASAPPLGVFESLEGVSVLQAEDDGKLVKMQVAGPIGPVVKAAARLELVDLVSREPNLEDIFLAHYG